MIRALGISERGTKSPELKALHRNTLTGQRMGVQNS